MHRFWKWQVKVHSFVQHFDSAKFAVFVGIILRLKGYFEVRPLRVDESWSAIEIVNRSFSEIIRHEYMFSVSSRPPTLFLLIAKVSTILFGNNELALRLPSLLFGISALVGFYYLAKNYLPRRAALIAIWLFALAERLVFYSAQTKRYSGMVLAAVLCWMLAALLFQGQYKRRRIFLFGLLSAVIIWFAYSSSFVVLSIFLLLAIKLLKEKKYREVLFVALAFLPFVISAVALYIYVIGDVQASTEMRGYFAPWLWQGKALSWQVFPWLGEHVVVSMRNPAGLMFPLVMLSLILVGIVSLMKRERWLALVFLLPIVLALVSAALGQYPFGARLILFLLPAYFIFLANGADALGTWSRRFNRWVLAVVLILVFVKPASDAVFYLSHTRTLAENRALLEFFSRTYRPGDSVYMNQGVRYPFYFYAGNMSYGKEMAKTTYLLADHGEQSLAKIGVFVDNQIFWPKKPWAIMIYEFLRFDEQGKLKQVFSFRKNAYCIIARETLPQFVRGGRAWLLISLIDEDLYAETEKNLTELFGSQGEILVDFRARGVAAFLYEMKEEIPGQ